MSFLQSNLCFIDFVFFRHFQNFQTNSIFGTFDDTLFQARAAQAALVEIDVKNVNMAASGMLRPSDMFTYVRIFF